jgi:hypothetical protein
MTSFTCARARLLAAELEGRVALDVGSRRAIGPSFTGQLRRLGGRDEVAGVVHLLCAEVSFVVAGWVWAVDGRGEG